MRRILAGATALARAKATGRGLLVWAGKEPANLSAPVIRRVEDGFLRSRGLGAELVPPLSLVADDLGIYYDPGRASRLEKMILSPLPPGGRIRAERLLARIRAAGVSKYNLAAAPLPDLPPGHRILVPGQVEDDASIRLGAGGKGVAGAGESGFAQRRSGLGQRIAEAGIAQVGDKPVHAGIAHGQRVGIDHRILPPGALQQAGGSARINQRVDPGSRTIWFASHHRGAQADFFLRE